MPPSVRLAGLFSELDIAIKKAGPLIEGDVAQEPAEIEAYTQLAAEGWVKTICETGFNAGHSALLLLAANPDAQVISFDLGQYGYTQAAKAWMEKKFGRNRFRFIQGDSTKTVPALHAAEPNLRCDLAIVDGGHLIEVARADLENFRQMANPEQNFVVVDDAPCDVGVCYGPYMALQEAVKDGRVSLLEEVVLGNLPKPFNQRGFSVARYNKVTPANNLAPFPAPPGLGSGTPTAAFLAARAAHGFLGKNHGLWAAPTLPAAKPKALGATTPKAFKFAKTAHTLEAESLVKQLRQAAPAASWGSFVVNLGAGDGKEGMPGLVSKDPAFEDPTYPLFTDLKMAGVELEGNPNYLPLLQSNLPAKNISKRISMITPSNVPQLLKDANTPLDFDFYKNDIDSDDCAVSYAVLRAGFRPKVVQMEVNPEVPYPLAFGIQYDPKFKNNLGLGGFYGCNVVVASAVVEPFGYELVGVGPTHDAFYVRQDVLQTARNGAHVQEGAQKMPAGLEGISDQQAADELATCCMAQHFGLGVGQIWHQASKNGKYTPAQLLGEVGKVVAVSCTISQQTSQTCHSPYTLSLNPRDFIAEFEALEDKRLSAAA